MKKLLTLLFVFCISYANSQDWITYKPTKISFTHNKVIDTLHVKIDSIRNKKEKENHKIYYVDHRGKSRGISTEEVVSYRMNNIIHIVKRYTVVYKDKKVVLTNENTPQYSNVAYVIDNSTGSQLDKDEKSDTTAKFTNDTAKEVYNQNNKIDIISNKLNKLESSVNEINLHLEKHHTEFKYGVICSVCGIGCTVGGIVLIASEQSKARSSHHNYGPHHTATAQSTTGYTVSGVGAAISVIGCTIMIDSDKWFSKKHNNRW